MEEQRHEPIETEEMTELSEQSRRDFITKMVAAAGTIAIAGLAGTAANAEVGDTRAIKIDGGKIDSGKLELGKKEQPGDIVSLKMGKFRNGFRLSLTGPQIGEAIKQMGVANDRPNLENATITIEFSA